MRNILPLYRNELEKIFHRATTWVLLALLVVSVFAIGGLMRAVIAVAERSFAQPAQYYTDENGNPVDTKDEYLKQLKANIAETRRLVDERLTLLASGHSAKAEAVDIGQLVYQQADLAVMELCLKYGIDYYAGWYYPGSMGNAEMPYDFRQEITTVVMPIAQALYELENRNREEALGARELLQYALAKQTMQRCEAVLAEGDYQAWLDLQIACLPLLGADAEEQAIMRKQIEMLRTANPQGKTNPMLILPGIQEIVSLERSLADDVDYDNNAGESGVPLTDKRREELQNDLAVARHRLEYGDFSVSQALESVIGFKISGFSIMKETGGTVLAVLVLMLAGAAVAQEINTGSIKALIIAPVRRWKILTAKIMSILTAAVGGSVLLLGSLLGAGRLFFRDEWGQAYIYARHGQAHALPFLAYRAAEIAVDLLPLFCWLLFALMISTVIRNTAAAVGVSVGGYFLSGTIGQFMTIGSSVWGMRFLPFQHLDLGAAVFSFANAANAQGIAMLTSGDQVKQSPLFSALYLLVLCLCFGWTAFDSFCRRDLK